MNYSTLTVFFFKRSYVGNGNSTRKARWRTRGALTQCLDPPSVLGAHPSAADYPHRSLKTQFGSAARADLAASWPLGWLNGSLPSSQEGRADRHISGMNRDERPPRGRSRDERPPGSGQIPERHAARAPGNTEAARTVQCTAQSESPTRSLDIEERPRSLADIAALLPAVPRRRKSPTRNPPRPSPGQPVSPLLATASTAESPSKVPHAQARSELNAAYKGKRVEVPDDKVPWNLEWGRYAPIEFTDAVVLENNRDLPYSPTSFKWADPPGVQKLRAELEKRTTYTAGDAGASLGGYIEFDEHGAPLNPEARGGPAESGGWAGLRGSVRATGERRRESACDRRAAPSRSSAASSCLLCCLLCCLLRPGAEQHRSPGAEPGERRRSYRRRSSHHGSSHHGSSHHGSSPWLFTPWLFTPRGSSYHGSSHHGSSHRGSSHHGSSHGGSSRGGSSHGGSSHGGVDHASSPGARRRAWRGARRGPWRRATSQQSHGDTASGGARGVPEVHTGSDRGRVMWRIRTTGTALRW